MTNKTHLAIRAVRADFALLRWAFLRSLAVGLGYGIGGAGGLWMGMRIVGFIVRKSP